MQIRSWFQRRQPAASEPPATLAPRPQTAQGAAHTGAEPARPGPVPVGGRLDRDGNPMDRLGAESPLGATSPRSLVETRPRALAFSGLGDAPPPPGLTSPRPPLETVHAPGTALNGHAATTMPEARVAARTGLTGAGLTAGALNGGAMVGLFSALPPVEPISISLSAVASASDAAAAYGAHRRGTKLREVQANAGNLACDHPGPGHERLRNETLPYMIEQQDKRKARKGRAAVPFVGAIGEGIRGVAAHFSKKKAGTLGVRRQAESQELARHLVPNNCELAEGMTEALFGRGRMEALRAMEPDDAAKAIATRLKTN